MINLHNHSTWSDGHYTPEQLVKIGIVGGLTHIGISDHFYTDKLVPAGACVDLDDIERYVAELRRVAELFAGRIGILAGIEVDWSFRARGRLPDLLDKIDQFDYVLFEYVEDSAWSGGTLEALCALLPFIHVPVGLAHNNLSQNFAASYAPEELVALLEEHDIFVELSTNPLTTYYRSTDPYSVRLWQVLAESSVQFSVGSDTHGYVDQVTEVGDAHRFLEERGLLARLITTRWDPVHQAWKGRS